MVKSAIDVGVPAPVLSAALFERFAARDEDHIANRVLAALRQQFAGRRNFPPGTAWNRHRHRRPWHPHSPKSRPR